MFEIIFVAVTYIIVFRDVDGELFVGGTAPLMQVTTPTHLPIRLPSTYG